MMPQVSKPCPKCKADVADCLAHAAVNREMEQLIKKLQEAAEAARAQAEELAEAGAGEDEEDGDAAGAEGEEEEGVEEEDMEEGTEGGKRAAEAGPSDVVVKKGAASRKKQRVEGDSGASGSGGAGGSGSKVDAGEAMRDGGEETRTESTAAAAAEEEANAKDHSAAAAAAGKGSSQGAASEAGTSVPEVPPVAGAAAGNGVAGRYSRELTQLREAFPEYDEGLIVGLLEDQGGDWEEVHAYLKVSPGLLGDVQRTVKNL
jgi:hypothetical protein